MNSGNLNVKQGLHFSGTGEGLAVGKSAAGIDGELAVLGAPLADGVVILEAEAEKTSILA